MTITAKYGAFIGDQWNALVGPGTDFAGMSWDWKDGYQTNYQEIMPGENMSIKKHNNGGTTRKLYYYIEDPDGDIEYDGLRFSLHNNIVFNFDESLYE